MWGWGEIKHRSVDNIIAENHARDDARTYSLLSFKAICEKIRSGEIQIPYSVSVERYAAMIRHIINNRPTGNIFLDNSPAIPKNPPDFA